MGTSTSRTVEVMTYRLTETETNVQGKYVQGNQENRQNPPQGNQNYGQNPAQSNQESGQNQPQSNQENGQSQPQSNQEGGQNPRQINQENGQNPRQINQENGQNQQHNNNDNQIPQKEAVDKISFVLQLCDASLLAANVSQLRVVLESGSENKYYLQLLVLIIISIVSHILFGMLMILRWRLKGRRNPENGAQNGDGGSTERCCLCRTSPATERCDNMIMYFTFVVVILNVAIAGLGLSELECSS